jgi:hypothetical protein
MAQVARDRAGAVLGSHAQLGATGQHRMLGHHLALVTDDEAAAFPHHLDRLADERNGTE